jgi:hypothetical protein
MADLGLLERNTYRSTWHDGLLDLFAGVGLLLIGAAWLTEYAGLGGIAPALLIPLWAPFRRKWIEPRAGTVRFREERVATERRKYFAMFALGSVAFVVGVGVYLAAREGGAGPGLPKALLAVLLGAAGLIVGLAFGQLRFVAYAMASLALGAWAVLADAHPAFQFLGLGACVTGTGAVLFFRFVRSHPIGDDGR